MTSLALHALALSTTLALSMGLSHVLAEPVPAPMAIAECAAPSRAMVRRELLFGTARADGASVREDEWQTFVDTVVTPRFPDGLTVLNALGQWRGQRGLTKEHSRILVIWHDRDPIRDIAIEAIRSVYKTRFNQESVLRVDSMSCVSF